MSFVLIIAFQLFPYSVVLDLWALSIVRNSKCKKTQRFGNCAESCIVYNGYMSVSLLVALIEILKHSRRYTFWDITLCSQLKDNRRFERKCPSCFRVWKLTKQQTSMKQVEIRTVLPICLFFDPEDGVDMFLRTVCWLSTDYTASIFEHNTLHTNVNEKLRYFKYVKVK
jgi:hypothetical protein